MIRLIDEEIQRCVREGMKPLMKNNSTLTIGNNIAKAQLKKVVGQIQEIGDVMPKGVRGNGEHLYVFPLQYYKALLEEVK